jgi:hypothetical protein
LVNAWLMILSRYPGFGLDGFLLMSGLRVRGCPNVRLLRVVGRFGRSYPDRNRTFRTHSDVSDIAQFSQVLTVQRVTADRWAQDAQRDE